MTKAIPVDLDFISKWEQLIQEVDMEDVPLELIERITVDLVTGKTLEFNIQELFAQGLSTSEIQLYVQEEIRDTHVSVASVIYHVHIRNVASKTEKLTQDLLKDIDDNSSTGEG